MNQACLCCGKFPPANLPNGTSRFCVHCGWPRVQECPYDCGERNIAVIADGDSRWNCPSCRRPLARSKDLRSGRAYRHGEEVGEPTESFVVDWPNFGGPRGTRTVSLKKSAFDFTVERRGNGYARQNPVPLDAVRTSGQTVVLSERDLIIWDELDTSIPVRISLNYSTVGRLTASGWNVFARVKPGIVHVDILTRTVTVVTGEDAHQIYALPGGNLLAAHDRGLVLHKFSSEGGWTESPVRVGTEKVLSFLGSPEGVVVQFADGNVGIVSGTGVWHHVVDAQVKGTDLQDPWLQGDSVVVPSQNLGNIRAQTFGLRHPFTSGTTKTDLGIDRSRTMFFTGNPNVLVTVRQGGGGPGLSASRALVYRENFDEDRVAFTLPDTYQLMATIGLSGATQVVVILCKEGAHCQLELRNITTGQVLTAENQIAGNLDFARLLGTEDGFVFVRFHGTDLIFARYSVTA